MSTTRFKTTTEPLPQTPVGWWEGIGVVAGASFLVMAALLGLINKAARNATSPERTEAIAHSLMSYTIPGGSRGIFGINVGSVKMAVIASSVSKISNLPAVELLIARTPFIRSKEIEPSPTSDNFDLVSFSGFAVSYDLEGQFQSQVTQRVQKSFCDSVVPVTIRRGILVMNDSTSPRTAVRYEATTFLDERQHQIILTTSSSPTSDKKVTAAQASEKVGAIAEQVFDSLQCR